MFHVLVGLAMASDPLPDRLWAFDIGPAVTPLDYLGGGASLERMIQLKESQYLSVMLDYHGGYALRWGDGKNLWNGTLGLRTFQPWGDGKYLTGHAGLSAGKMLSTRGYQWRFAGVTATGGFYTPRDNGRLVGWDAGLMLTRHVPTPNAPNSGTHTNIVLDVRGVVAF